MSESKRAKFKRHVIFHFTVLYNGVAMFVASRKHGNLVSVQFFIVSTLALNKHWLFLRGHPLSSLCNWKFVGTRLYATPNRGGVCVVVFGEGCTVHLPWTPLDTASQSLFSLSSLSEKSERELPASERENGWWVAYGSMTDPIQRQYNSVLALLRLCLPVFDKTCGTAMDFVFL